MHMLIRGLVYAENEHDALLTAKHDVFEPLVRDRTFDYYLTFDEEGRGFSGQDRWGELPIAAPASTKAGELLIEEGWEATVNQYKYHLDRLEEFFANHETSELWEDFDTHHEYHYDFSSVGEFQGPSTFLYDQHGQGIRDKSHLENLYPLNDQNQSESTGEELYAVPADVHYWTRGDATITDYEEEKPLATWEAAFLGWTWEAYEKDDDGLYYGRVKSPMTYDIWEYGYFTEDQLRTAGAYRTDVDIDDDEERFPDDGYTDDPAQAKLYKTELDTFFDDAGGDT